MTKTGRIRVRLYRGWYWGFLRYDKGRVYNWTLDLGWVAIESLKD